MRSRPFAVSFFVPEWVPCQGPPLAALVFTQQNRRTKRKETSERMSLFFCDFPLLLLSVNQRFLSCLSGDVAAPSSSSVTI